MAPGWRSSYSAKGPVSRILSCAVIPLGAALPRTLISDLPGGFGNCLSRLGAPGRCATPPDSWRRFPPYLVLLRVGFTLPPALPTERCALAAPFHPYPGAGGSKLSPGSPSKLNRRGSRGGIFSVALAVHGFEVRVPDVIRHTALRSSDFPPPANLVSQPSGSDRPVLLPGSSVPRIEVHLSRLGWLRTDFSIAFHLARVSFANFGSILRSRWASSFCIFR